MAFPQTVLVVAVEFWIDDAWVDFTRISDRLYCLSVAGRDGIEITRGQSPEDARVTPSTLTLTFFDQDAYLDTTNAESPYYGKLGRRTLVRITVDGNSRCVLRVSKFTPTWVKSADASEGHLITVAVDASGPMSALEQGNQPIKSVAYRALTSPSYDSDRLVYFPCEEESEATIISSPYSAGFANYAGTLDFGSFSDSMCSARLLSFGSTNALIFITIPTWTYTTQQNYIMLLRFPETPLADNTVLLRFYPAGGTISFIDLVYGTGGTTRWLAYAGGVLVATSSTTAWGTSILDREVLFDIDFVQDGADIDISLGVGNSNPSKSAAANTISAQTMGRVYAVTIGQTDCTGLGFGHFAGAKSTSTYSAFTDFTGNNILGAAGNVGEAAAIRMDRLCDEEGITLDVIGTSSSSQPMGRQKIASIIDLLYACVDVDNGILRESRTAWSLTYKTGEMLYNQAPKVHLTYADHVSEDFFPVPDDLNVKTRTIASRTDGGSASYTVPDDDSLHLTTQDPTEWKNGWGLAEDPPEFVCEDDAQLGRIAAWRTHVRSWAGKRVPVCITELERGIFAVDAVLTAAVVNTNIGDVIVVDTSDAPRWLPADEVRLLVRGYTETLGQFQRRIRFVTTNEDPYEVEVVDTSGATLVQAMTNVGTSAYVATSLGPSFWNDELNLTPFRITAGDNAMEVASSGVLVQTITFIAAGTAVHDANAAGTSTLAPGLPAGVTIDSRQLLLVWAAIRNSGTGTVNTPTGWGVVAGTDFGNCKLLWRWYRTGGVGSNTPTITFSGGAANETISAVMFAFANASPYASSGPTTSTALACKQNPTSATQLNGSAQNMDFPAARVHRNKSVILWLGWKQDDWTSRTAVSGATEAVDVSSTLGNDQGVSVDYQIQTTATDIAALTSTVTGGASAISRGIVVALRPIALLSVTRGTNNVSTAIAADEAVNVWKPGVNGL